MRIYSLAEQIQSEKKKKIGELQDHFQYKSNKASHNLTAQTQDI